MELSEAEVIPGPLAEELQQVRSHAASVPSCMALGESSANRTLSLVMAIIRQPAQISHDLEELQEERLQSPFGNCYELGPVRLLVAQISLDTQTPQLDVNVRAIMHVVAPDPRRLIDLIGPVFFL